MPYCAQTRIREATVRWPRYLVPAVTGAVGSIVLSFDILVSAFILSGSTVRLMLTLSLPVPALRTRQGKPPSIEPEPDHAHQQHHHHQDQPLHVDFPSLKSF